MFLPIKLLATILFFNATLLMAADESTALTDHDGISYVMTTFGRQSIDALEDIDNSGCLLPVLGTTMSAAFLVATVLTSTDEPWFVSTALGCSSILWLGATCARVYCVHKEEEGSFQKNLTLSALLEHAYHLINSPNEHKKSMARHYLENFLKERSPHYKNNFPQINDHAKEIAKAFILLNEGGAFIKGHDGQVNANNYDSCELDILFSQQLKQVKQEELPLLKKLQAHYGSMAGDVDIPLTSLVVD